MAQLIVYEPGSVPSSLALGGPLEIGRDAQCALSLVHHQVSRRHVGFERERDGWFVRDLGSANGTFVNGARVERARLSDGDRIKIGPFTLVFEEQSAPEIVMAQKSWDEETIEIGPPNQRLELLYEVTFSIGAMDDLHTLLLRMLEGTLRLVGGERAMVVLVDGNRRETVKRVVVRGEETSDAVVVPRIMRDAMFERREAVLGRELSGRDPNDTMARLGILSAMGAPLEIRGRLLGYLYVDNRSFMDTFSAEDLTFVNALTRLAAVAIDQAERLATASSVAEAASGIGPVQDLLGQSSAMQKVRTLISKCAASPKASVLIHGETGTGKELVARALHAASPRARRAFVAVKCAGSPETMIEGALFGHEKGAFSGALHVRKGQFTLADQGTLFFDEIADLSLSAQAKVLRAMREGEVSPLGTERTMSVDVRIIAATSKDLRRAVAEGKFREDLYYRLNVLQIDVPPLRERPSDIELLARTFLESAALNLGQQGVSFSPQAMAAIMGYSWPGNARELRNEIERAILVAEGSVIDAHDLSPEIERAQISTRVEVLPTTPLAERFAALDTTERAIVEEALLAARGNLAEAARQLGITRIMMRRRVDKFGLKYQDT